MSETIAGSVTRVRFSSDRYSVVEVRDKDSGTKIAVTGRMVDVLEDDEIVITGNWKDHPKWGRQFEATLVRNARNRGHAEVAAVLSKLADNGSTRMARLDLVKGLCGLGISLDETAGLIEAATPKTIHVYGDDIGDALAVTDELLIAAKVEALLARPQTPFNDDPPPAVLELDPEQERARWSIALAPITVITGGAGVGKTTVLREALRILAGRGICPDCGALTFIPDCASCAFDADTGADPTATSKTGVVFASTVALCAPTGKAALRMYEATGTRAKTIHRTLGAMIDFDTQELYFTFTRDNPLPVDLVVIDEASMMDVWIGARLFEAIDPRRTRVVLIGDVEQLPPVGAGRVFADLIESGRVPVVRLETLHRAAAQSWVAVNARRVLRGELVDFAPRPDFVPILVTSPGEVLGAVQWVAQNYRVDQAICPQNVGVIGTEALNPILRDVFLPEPRTQHPRCNFFVGEKVIQTVNDYKVLTDSRVPGVVNGEIGTVAAGQADELVVDFGDRKAFYTKKTWGQLRSAYAITVHKSQGSEFDYLLVVCHSANMRMLSRKLFYTALTRAKKGVILVGDLLGVQVAIHNTREALRSTWLRDRLVNGGSPCDART